MADYNVTLSAATRSNLLSLQNTAALTATNQNRLSTGKKVNSALDNPTNFFTASALSDRSSALNGLLDGISNGVQTIQAASKGIDSVTNLVKSLQSTVKQAQADAVANRPKIAGTLDLGSAAEVTATGKSARDVTLSKKLTDDNGATANTATSSYAGNLGITDTTTAYVATTTDGKANTVQLKAGNTTYSFDFGSTSTVRDLVDNINKSGIATASVGDDGKLTITGSGSDKLSVDVGVTTQDKTSGAKTFAADDTITAKVLGTATHADVGASGSSAVRSNLVKQFNDLRGQLDSLAKDSGFNGTNLLAGDKLSIVFNEKTGANQNKLDIQGNTVSSDNLGIGSFVDGTVTGNQYNVQNDADLGKAADSLTNSLASLRSLSSTLGSNLSTVQTRQDFTKQLSDVLNTGASNLTNADLNEEAANSNALSTRQSLGISALSLANQANQGILQLLR